MQIMIEIMIKFSAVFVFVTFLNIKVNFRIKMMEGTKVKKCSDMQKL